VECIPVGDRELRKLGGVWYEVTFARLPEPEYESYRIVEAVPKTHYFDSPVHLVEKTVWRLVTPGCFDVVTGESVLAGPKTDDEPSRQSYRAGNPLHRDASAKRQLSRRELRQHGLSNDR
jgi:hypothetical protein